jgi:hypothetical protein
MPLWQAAPPRGAGTAAGFAGAAAGLAGGGNCADAEDESVRDIATTIRILKKESGINVTGNRKSDEF